MEENKNQPEETKVSSSSPKKLITDSTSETTPVSCSDKIREYYCGSDRVTFLA